MLKLEDFSPYNRLWTVVFSVSVSPNCSCSGEVKANGGLDAIRDFKDPWDESYVLHSHTKLQQWVSLTLAACYLVHSHVQEYVAITNKAL